MNIKDGKIKDGNKSDTVETGKKLRTKVGIGRTRKSSTGSIVPDIGAGRCLGPEGNRVSLGEGGDGGPSPPRKQGR